MQVCSIIAHSAAILIPSVNTENTRLDCNENYVCQNYTDWIAELEISRKEKFNISPHSLCCVHPRRFNFEHSF